MLWDGWVAVVFLWALEQSRSIRSASYIAQANLKYNCVAHKAMWYATKIRIAKTKSGFSPMK